MNTPMSGSGQSTTTRWEGLDGGFQRPPKEWHWLSSVLWPFGSGGGWARAVEGVTVASGSLWGSGQGTQNKLVQAQLGGVWLLVIMTLHLSLSVVVPL